MDPSSHSYLKSLALTAAAATCVVAMVPAGKAFAQTTRTLRVYQPELADQFQTAHHEETIPQDPAARRAWAEHLAFDATLYGTAPVLEYRQMYDQVALVGSAGHAPFNAFAHGRDLAGPDYSPFKTPNADTLYSNAWVDLRSGPVLFDVPPTAGRYYTANFLDIFGNATNISARTHGMTGGRYLIATTDWAGDVPKGATVFRVTTPFMWILLRVLVSSPAELPAARALQDRFLLQGPAVPDAAKGFPDGHDLSAIGFMRSLDFVLRQTGVPANEASLVAQWRGIGIAGQHSFDEATVDPEIRDGIEAGFAAAQQVIARSITQLGPRRNQWSQAADIGRYGNNYLYRAAINTLGTGANVVDENFPFTTFTDATGLPLDGAAGDYELKLASPPPARYFWSVTVYDAATKALYPNAPRKYVLGDRTPGLKRGADGNLTIRFAHAAPDRKWRANSLPIPAGRFYVAIRAQGPKDELLNGQWQPSAIERLKPAEAK